MSRHVLDDVDQFKKEHRELKHPDGWFYCQCETARRLRQLYQYHDIIKLRLERAKKRKK